jgi:hypothetical protein
MTNLPDATDAAGAAALAICKSLIRSLRELNILSEQDVRGLLTDVATMHSEAALTSAVPAKDHAVATIVKEMLALRTFVLNTE